MSAKPKTRTIEILLVEDSPSDALLTKRALSDAWSITRVHVVRDGVEAMAFLRKEPSYADAPRPNLILLDLNMPRKNGKEVLTEIKTDETLSTIPVCILTTSQDNEDAINCYKLHANCYIVKPVGFDSFVNAFKVFENFWFSIVTLPR